MDLNIKTDKKVFRLNDKGGVELTSGVVFSIVSMIALTAMVTLFMNHRKEVKRESAESITLVTAHGVANLLKQDLLYNYESRYLAGKEGWPLACGNSSNRNIYDFVSVLKSPTAACANTQLYLPFLGTSGVSKTVNCLSTPNQCVALSNFRTANLKADTAYNGYDITVTLTGFGMSSSSQLEGEVQLVRKDFRGVANEGLSVKRTTRLQIDLDRLNNPELNAVQNCRACRNTPGALCCDSQFPVSYLDGQGRVFDAILSSGVVVRTLRAGIAENPLALSMKVSPTPTVYTSGAYCLPASSPRKNYWVIDAVVYGSRKYFLTTHGRLVDENITDLWTVPDPKFVSIAHDGDQFILLRSDGQLFKLANGSIANPDQMVEMAGYSIPLAEKLVMGEGPALEACPE